MGITHRLWKSLRRRARTRGRSSLSREAADRVPEGAPPRAEIGLRVNGRAVVAQVEPADTLLDVLRDQLGLTGAKGSCRRGECGSCTVLVDGKASLACLTLASRTRGEVSTVEGLAAEGRDLRESFGRLGGFQCGFCTPGQIVRGIELLRRGLPDDEPELRRAMSGNVCRCTGYTQIIAAMRRTEAIRISEGSEASA